MALAAYLYYHYHMKQTEIAEQLNKPQGHISKLLAEAKRKRKNGKEWVRTIIDIPEKIMKEVYGYINDGMNAKIQEHFGDSRLDAVVVVPSPKAKEKETDEEKKRREEERNQRVYKGAAYHLKNIIENMAKEKHVKIGVSWGLTIKETATQLAKIIEDEKKLCKKLIAYPLFGDMLFKIGENPGFYYRYTASAIAADINKAAREEDRSIALSAPAYISCKEKEKEIDRVKKYVESNPSYNYIYLAENSKKAPLIDQMDIFLLGLSSLDMARPWINSTSLISSDELKELKKNNVPGDLSGIFLPFPHDKKISLIEKLNKRSMGPQKEHLSKAKDRKAKVMAIAAQPEKAKTLISAIEKNYLTDIIISEDLAKEIIDIRKINIEKE